MKHKEWRAVQKGCITPGAKPCTMCEKAYNAGRTSKLAEGSSVMYRTRVGTKKAFGRWVLMWEGSDGCTRTVKISAEIAKQLIEDGVCCEG